MLCLCECPQSDCVLNPPFFWGGKHVGSSFASSCCVCLLRSFLKEQNKTNNLFSVLFEICGCRANIRENDQLVLQMRQASNNRGTFNITTLTDDEIEVLYDVRYYYYCFALKKVSAALCSDLLLFTIRMEADIKPLCSEKQRVPIFSVHLPSRMRVRSFQINITTEHTRVVT